MPTTPSGCGISRFLAGMNCSAVATRRGAIHFFRCLTVCLISPSTNINSANRVSMLLRWPKSAEIAASNRASLSATTARNRASRSRRCSSVAAGSDRDRSNRRWKASSRALWPGLFSDWSMAFSSTLSVGLFPAVPCRFYRGLSGRKAGLLRGVWQERFVRAGFVPKSAIPGILAVTKSSKVASQPFPKRACVGTYPSHPKAFVRGCLLRKPRDGLAALRALAKDVSALGFSARRATVYRGVEQPGSSSGS